MQNEVKEFPPLILLEGLKGEIICLREVTLNAHILLASDLVIIPTPSK